jgi:hypothetical protein
VLANIPKQLHAFFIDINLTLKARSFLHFIANYARQSFWCCAYLLATQASVALCLSRDSWSPRFAKMVLQDQEAQAAIIQDV